MSMEAKKNHQQSVLGQEMAMKVQNHCTEDVVNYTFLRENLD